MAHRGEEPLERFDGADPEQAGDADIDLVDQRVLQTSGHDMLDGIEDLSREVRKASAVSFHETRRA
jgi:hypothetical protein